LFHPNDGFRHGISVEDGHIAMPELSGIGFEGKANLRTEMHALAA
jgi:hypothetical protein